MKKLFNALLAAFSLLTFTACFDITEDVTVNKDGSGIYVSTMDATKLGEQLKAFAAFDSTGEMIPKLKYSLDSTFRDLWTRYSKVKGISNLKIDTSKEYVYKMTMNFTDFTALNTAINIDKKDATQKDIYTWEKGKVSRKDAAMNLGDLGAGGDDQQKEMAKGMLKEMTYKTIFRLPNDVKTVSNKAAKIESDKKTVVLECNLLEATEGTVKLGTEINYKN